MKRAYLRFLCVTTTTCPSGLVAVLRRSAARLPIGLGSPSRRRERPSDVHSFHRPAPRRTARRVESGWAPRSYRGTRAQRYHTRAEGGGDAGQSCL